MKNGLHAVMILFLTMILARSSTAQEYTVQAVSNGGSISGKVLFEGTPPKPKVMTVTKDKKIAGKDKRLVDVVVVNDGKLAEAVIYLEKISAGKDWPKLTDGGLIDQKGARFIPHSRVIPAGMKVPIKNSDPVMHNIHAYELIGRGRRTLFNKGQPRGLTFNLPFDVKRSHFVKLECDAHNFMHDYLFVASNPYYSVSAKDGSYAISDVPPGSYTLMIWHPNLGTRKVAVTVKAGQAVAHDFTFKAKASGGTK